MRGHLGHTGMEQGPGTWRLRGLGFILGAMRDGSAAVAVGSSGNAVTPQNGTLPAAGL